MAAALAVSASGLSAQLIQTGRVGGITESYSFDPGLVLSKVTETTIPVGIDLRLGRRMTLGISSGYARVSLTSADTSQLKDQSVSGALDTEARLGFSLLPGKLMILLTGTVPTGIKTVQRDQLSILGAISSDVIGFASPTIGSGGGIGGGFAGALPIGSWALGIGGTYRVPMSYEPVLGQSTELKPGAEMRLRLGLEGPLARKTYVRLAGVFASRGKDQVASQAQNGVGNRFIEYLAVNQGLGAASLSVYGFDVYRASPQIEATAAGSAVLPRGNLLAVGSRLGIPLGRSISFTPRVEYRRSTAAAVAYDSATASYVDSGGPLETLGTSWRFGADFRVQLTRSFAVTLQGGRASGSVVQGGNNVNFRGFRFALQGEVRP